MDYPTTRIGGGDAAYSPPATDAKVAPMQDKLNSMNNRLDGLMKAIDVLEKRLSPITLAPPPAPEAAQGARAEEPAAILVNVINEMNRRITGATRRIEAIVGQLQL